MNANQKKKLLKQTKQQSGRFYSDAEIEKMQMQWTRKAFAMTLYFSIISLRDTFLFGKGR